MRPHRFLMFTLATALLLPGGSFFALRAASAETPRRSGEGIEDFLFMPMTVASTEILTPRESPGIVTVITQKEIEDSGARDMVDVLTLLAPGYQFGLDLEQNVGLGVRGLWAFEGKVLVMVDGIEMNEGMYATVVFGNHYPVENIEKIEIIRGPGSAIYGGNAGAGVINIITKGANSNQAYVYGLQSQMKTRYSHSNAGFGVGKENVEGVSYSLTATKGNGYRSQREMPSIATGAPVPGTSRFDLDPEIVNAHARYKGLGVREIVDRFSHGERGSAGNTLRSRFWTYAYSMRYDLKPANNIVLTPKIEYRVQRPWNVNATDVNGYINDKRVEKQLYSLSATWDVSAHVNTIAGVDYFPGALVLPDNPNPGEVNTIDPATGEGSGEFVNSGTGARLGKKLLDYRTAGYVQTIVITDWANVTMGARFDHYNKYGNAFSPRAGLTRVWGDWHAKMMAAKSFRAPAGIVSALELPGKKVRPEIGTSYEAELGRKITKNAWVVFNAFDSKFKDLIVYGVAPVENYQNIGQFGTRGFEAEFRYRAKPVGGHINYAYYRAYDNETAYYSLAEHKGFFLAFSPHRVNALLDINLTDTLSVHPSLSFFGHRYALTRIDSTMPNGYVHEQLAGFALIHVNVRIRDLVTKGLELDLGVRNILDRNYAFINPYPGNAAPLPADNRAYVGKLVYAYNFR